ncbi:hypothetical protein ABPG74_015804 [Tetrahymena malaccensis]
MQYSSFYQSPSLKERSNIQRQFLANYSNLGYSSPQLTITPTSNYQFQRHYEGYPYYYNKYYEDYPYSAPPKKPELFQSRYSHVAINQEDSFMKSNSTILDNKPPRTYTSTYNVIYKCGEQLENKFKKEDLSKSLTNYEQNKISQQYRQPTYLDSSVYNKYYEDHSDQEQRDQLLKTVYREQNNELKDQIIFIFKEMILFEREIENIKQSLCKQKDVSFDQIFKIFDLELNNQVTPFELDRGLTNLKIFADKIDIYLLAIRYSKNGRDTMNVEDFFQMIEPSKQDQEYQHVYQDKNILFNDLCDLSQSYIIKLFKMLLNQESAIQYYRKDIQNKGLKLDEIYQTFDPKNSQNVQKQDFFQWIKENGIYVNENEFKKFFQRFDRSNTGAIHFIDFVNELTPKYYKKGV